jgi:hypothetical protein
MSILTGGCGGGIEKKGRIEKLLNYHARAKFEDGVNVGAHHGKAHVTARVRAYVDDYECVCMRVCGGCDPRCTGVLCSAVWTVLV